MWLTKLGYRILRSTSSIDLPVNSGDFKLISRTVADHLIRFEDNWPFLRGLVPWIGFRQVPVFYDREARPAGQSKYRVLSSRVINHFLFGIISFSDLPLKAPLWIGATIVAGAFIYLVVRLVVWACGTTPTELSIVLFALLLLSGLQLLMFGGMGLYVSAIHDQVRNRPRYIVKSRIGFEDG